MEECYLPQVERFLPPGVELSCLPIVQERQREEEMIGQEESV